jgi:hypothetical protein
MELHQKKLFIRKTFRLTETGLYFKDSNLTNSYETEIPYQEINFSKISKQKKSNTFLNLLVIIFGLASILNLILLVSGTFVLDWRNLLVTTCLTFIFALLSYSKSNKHVFIPTENDGLLEFFAAIPDNASVDNFLENLFKKIASFLKKKYATLDKDLPIDHQLSNLIWLKEKDILSDDEFTALKNELLKRNTNPIGFKE